MSKFDIISGFLGAGKTTLIKKLIKESLNKEKIVLIENEFGEIGIDGSFLKDSGIQVNEMNSGCICCSLVGDFSIALKQVIQDYHPDRIIIEPSGVGKLSDVIQAVKDLNDKELTLNSFVAVIDAKKCQTYSLNFGEFFNNQIEYASTIILSRTQDIDQDRLNNCIKVIKEFNQNANIITTPWLEMSGDLILAALENKDSLKDSLMKDIEICKTCGHHHDEHCDHPHEHHHDEECHCHHEHHHDAHDIFNSIGKETIHTYSREQLESILKTLSTSDEFGGILRAKGILQTPEKSWLHFDLVPGEYEIRSGTSDYTGRICVIGHQLNEAKIEELFEVK